MRFHNRVDAGRQLAAQLTEYAGRSDVIVLGLPRGGVPVAHEVATRLKAPLDVFLVRKLGVPGHPELAMGAIAVGGIEVLNWDLIRDLGIPHALVEQVAVRERLELERRDALYRGNRRPAVVRDRTVILVDDGLATGSTMQAAILALQQHAPARIVVAVPVGARETCERLARTADAIVCVSMPEPFNAVGLWYEEFSQTTDDEVTRLLALAAQPIGADRQKMSKRVDALSIVRNRAVPLKGDPAQYDTLLEGIGDARVALLGEATHGTHEFYRERTDQPLLPRAAAGAVRLRAARRRDARRRAAGAERPVGGWRSRRDVPVGAVVSGPASALLEVGRHRGFKKIFS